MHLRVILCFALVSTSAGTQVPKRADAPARRITIGVLNWREDVPDSSEKSSGRGVTLGIEEAERTARLFGWEVAAMNAPDSLHAREAVRFLIARGVTAIVGNLTGTLQPGRTSRRVPLLLDLGKRRQTTPCSDGEFHLLPVLDSARWSAGDQRELFARYAGLQAWSSSLERFGAAQLNERYRKRFGREMDEQGWAGWMSIKLVVDAVLKKGTTDPCTLEHYLLTDARFDGHKGVPLYFNPNTRELVQPLFAERPSGEAEPVDIQPASGSAIDPSGLGPSFCSKGCA